MTEKQNTSKSNISFDESITFLATTGTKEQVKEAARKQGIKSAEFYRQAIKQALADARELSTAA